jgi:hypothetical protein
MKKKYNINKEKKLAKEKSKKNSSPSELDC